MKEKNSILGNWIVRNLILGVLFVLLVVAAASIFLSIRTRHGKEVTVPDLSGLSVQDAASVAGAADLVVLLRLPMKKDSSTGYGQIFGWVALNAANYALDHGLATYESLGIKSDHRLDPSQSKDVRQIWRMLHRNPYANIELATLNIVAAADEVLGRTDFENFSENDMKLVFSRYNANVSRITSYGERAFQLYRRFSGSRSTASA